MRFSDILPLLMTLPLAQCGPDPSGPCRAGSSATSDCKPGPTNAITSVEINGDLSTCGFVGTSEQPTSVCTALCPADKDGACVIASDDPRKLVCSATPFPCTGRRPAGFETTCEVTDLASYFVQLAELESASVEAFAILRGELEHHCAPNALVVRAAEAMEDERRHVDEMQAIAQRPHPTSAQGSSAPRPLLELAVENAVEGCVHETYGAAVGAWQARRAPLARVRAAFARVAPDEARHADLAWDVHAWAMTILPNPDRVCVLAAMRDAVDALRRQPQPRVADVGLPTSGESAMLIDTLARCLWHRERADETARACSKP